MILNEYLRMKQTISISLCFLILYDICEIFDTTMYDIHDTSQIIITKRRIGIVWANPVYKIQDVNKNLFTFYVINFFLVLGNTVIWNCH